MDCRIGSGNDEAGRLPPPTPAAIPGHPLRRTAFSDPMADKPKKPHKLKARLPRGLVDRTASDIAATRTMLNKIQKVYELYGFEPVETPAIEYTDALGKFLPDQDRPNEGVFSFQDDDDQWLSLRYDLTAPLARHVAERIGTENFVLPYRSYRYGWVFRNEKPGPGRFRQFMQFDADTVGSASPAADAEMCMMAADAMEALGFARGEYVVKVNNRKVLDGVMEAIGVADEKQKLTVLRAIDKRDKFPDSEVCMLLGAGRWDGGEEGKGDFTKGAGLANAQITRLFEFLELLQMAEAAMEQHPMSRVPIPGIVIDKEKAIRGAVLDTLHLNFTDSRQGTEGVFELKEISRLVVAAGYGPDRIRVDPSVVRGLEYYTGPVFEVELLIETNDDKGRPVRFGSVGGGGRYDGLVSRFRGEAVPATGFSIGVSRLRAALDLIGKESAPPVYGPVVVTVFDKERLADYQAMVAMLRGSPVDPAHPDGPRIRAELYLGNPRSMGNQLKYADARNSPCAVVQGSNEREHACGPHVIVQDLIAGRAIGADIEDRDEYLKKKAVAQELVPLADVVAKVREVIGRHGVAWT
jgi:histidyl-tRNA synthetase